MRQFARAFVFKDEDSAKQVAYVSADMGMGSDLLNQKVCRCVVVIFFRSCFVVT